MVDARPDQRPRSPTDARRNPKASMSWSVQVERVAQHTAAPLFVPAGAKSPPRDGSLWEQADHGP